jgi:hypothetical protein
MLCPVPVFLSMFKDPPIRFSIYLNIFMKNSRFYRRRYKRMKHLINREITEMPRV